MFTSHEFDFDSTISQGVSHAYRPIHVLRTTKGACVYITLVTKVIMVFRLMDSLGKYAFRIQRVDLFIDCNVEGDLMVVYWRSVIALE